MESHPGDIEPKPNRIAVARQLAQRMQADITRQIQRGFLKAGDALPSEHTLAKSYGVSRSTAHNVLVRLREEQLVYTVTGVGAFVGSPGVRHGSSGMYLLLNCENPDDAAQRLRRGFEAEASRDGLATVGVAYSRLQTLVDADGVADLRGILINLGHSISPEVAFPLPPALRDVPLVRYCGEGCPAPDADTVTFDQVDGGRQAAQHLLEAGHTRIAFLALHQATEGYWWSRQRAQGWRDALQRPGVACGDDAILMPSGCQPGGWDRQVAEGYDAAAAFTCPSRFTAVVAADDAGAMGLIRRLQEAGRPPENWPAIVSFDDTDVAAQYGFTSLRHPWEDLGKAAAELLHERRAGRSAGPAEMRALQLHLIRRATSKSSHYSLVDELVRAATA